MKERTEEVKSKTQLCWEFQSARKTVQGTVCGRDWAKPWGASKRLRQTCALVLALSLAVVPIAFSASAAPNSWESFRGDTSNSGLTSAPTPTLKSGYQVKARWSKLVLSTSLATGWAQGVSAPVIAEGCIFVATNNQLLKLSSLGTQLVAAPLAEPLSMVGGYLAYGEGKIFVPLGDGSIQAFSATTLAPLWRSTPQATTPQINGALIYREGFLYAAATDGTEKNGTVFCLSTADTNPSSGSELQPLLWSYTSPSIGTKGSFYGTGVALTESAVLFGGEDGLLVSLSLSTGASIDSVNLGEPMRGSVLYAAGATYVTTTAGSVFRVPVDASGHFDSAQKSQATLTGGVSTTTPVLYRQKVYVISGAFGSGYLDVFAATTLQKRSTLALSAYSQSSPLLSTAYATAANGYQIYLYLSLNDDPDTLVALEDSDNLATPKASALFAPGGAYSMSSPIADAQGNVYVASDLSVYDANWTMTNRSVFLWSVGEDAVPVATKVSIVKPALTTLLVKKTLQLKATITPATAAQKITWKSSKLSVASVSTSGKVTAKKVGKTVITAITDNGKTASLTITVRAKVQKLSFVKAPKTLKVGKSKTLKVKLNPTTAKGVKLTWKSSKPKVIKVNASGKITALKRGTATITVKADSKTKKITIRVK